MAAWSRRTFLQCTMAAAAAAVSPASRAEDPAPAIDVSGGQVHVKATAYSFSYVARTDVFTISDAQGRRVGTGKLQPVVVVSPAADGTARLSSTGKAKMPLAAGNRLTLRYEGVNGQGTLTLVLRFEADGFWMDRPVYENAELQDVVSLHYFARIADGKPTADLRATYTTIPGNAENPAMSPIQVDGMSIEQTLSLGHSGFYAAPYTHQQWGLPVHYFCTTSTTTQAIDGGRRDTYTKFRSATMTCGLADLPNGDSLFDLRRGGHTSLWIDHRSDLWHHIRTSAPQKLGATLVFSFGDEPLSSIAAYYRKLLNAGIIARKVNSPAKNALLTASQYCTWGAQVMRDKGKNHLDEGVLEDFYAELKRSGMKARIFSIDDKWEGRYGNLEHDAQRFPNFVGFLDRVRSEGHEIGLWTAFLRCEDPKDLGLEVKHMLQTAAGVPHRGGRNEYYILDFTHPEVERVLTDRARAFMRRYKPAVVKFDFGYELPAVRSVAPADRSFAGEMLLKKGLDIIIGALRQENPDVVVMYYQLSPLFVQYFDLHSTDDLYLAAGDYDYEANRRIYFASPLAELGVAIYGSSGYDWSSSPAIWFDSVASGSIGSLNDFKDDEFGEAATDEVLALYNGFAQTVRPGGAATIIPYPPARPEATVRGAHGKSWARLERDQVTLIAQRPLSFDDGDAFDHRETDPRVAGLVTATAPVVVSAPSGGSIKTAMKLAIVPCGEGVLSLKRQRGKSASVTTHLFGGATSRAQVNVRDGLLSLALTRKGEGSKPVEWLEVDFTA